MSQVRRWKSFQITKNSDGSRTGGPSKPIVTKRKKTLVREKSLSMEQLPLQKQLQCNELFNRQKQKREQEEKEEKKNEKFAKRKNRKSRSCDDISIWNSTEVNFRRNQDKHNPRVHFRSRYNTRDVLQSYQYDKKSNLRMICPIGSVSLITDYQRLSLISSESTMSSHDIEKFAKKHEKNAIRTVELRFVEASAAPSDYPETNLKKSKSDWYINLSHHDVRQSAAEKMWNRCVIEWLKDLRFSIEYYEEFHLNLQEMNSDLKFAEEKRCSHEFFHLEALAILPVVYESLNPEDLPDNVIMWKNNLRHTYYGEEEIFLENEELMSNFENDSTDHLNKPANFPVPEDEEEEVALRTRKLSLKQERPKTFASTPTTKKKDDILEFKGVARLEIEKKLCVKIRLQESLRLFNNQLQLLDQYGNVKETLQTNVILKPGVKIISKVELEMLDSNNLPYRLYFDTTKDAKLFRENEKNYQLPSNSSYKNNGAWFGLLKLLKKRSSRDFLESKGIIKNEPIFGNTLEELCDSEHPVPEVVLKMTQLIEEPENIKTVGLYRTSANLAVVQNIRCEINCGRWEILDKYKKDVDVLTNTVKLFFRELKEPIISYEIFQQLRIAIRDQSDINSIIDSLPRANRETLLHLFRHLLKVFQYKNENKMDLHNISICWGPSLITLPANCTDLVTQTTEFTKLTEDLLIYYSKILQITPQEPVKNTDYIFDVIHKLTSLIELNIETEGIYRKSGSSTKLEKILKLIEKKQISNLDAKCDVHDLCGVLKKYIASIRKDIVPDEFFFRFLKICDNQHYNIKDEVRQMVEELNRKDIVYLLFEHLSRVVYYESKNKMSLTILSDMWMATLSANIENYKKKIDKYTKLFLILTNLTKLPDLVADPRMRLLSKYDNVPENSHGQAETDKTSTRL